MRNQIPRILLLVALLYSLLTSSAPALARDGGDRVCQISFSATSCVVTSGGNCSTQKCKNLLACSYSACTQAGKGF
jgi:Fe-S cluster biogenesis protein NfuA